MKTRLIKEHVQVPLPCHYELQPFTEGVLPLEELEQRSVRGSVISLDRWDLLSSFNQTSGHSVVGLCTGAFAPGTVLLLGSVQHLGAFQWVLHLVLILHQYH